MLHNAMDIDFKLVEVLGMRGLFTDAPLDARTLPGGLYRYGLRHDGDGNIVAVQWQVLEHFAGTLLLEGPLTLAYPLESPVQGISLEEPGAYRSLGTEVRLSSLEGRSLSMIQVPLQKEMLSVNTPFGRLITETDYDPERPGFTISIELEEDGHTYLEPLAAIEVTPDHPCDGKVSLRLLSFPIGQENFDTDITYDTKEMEGAR